METPLWFIKQSLSLDVRFLRVSRWGIGKKVEFLTKKYWLIFKHYYHKFFLGKSWVYLFGSKVFYDSKFGIAGYQRILSCHQDLLCIAGIKSAKIIVDVGANVGFFSKLCRELFPNSRIYAIEPIPQINSCLKRNFAGDVNTTLSDVAISDVAGKTSMNFNDELSSISSFNKNGNIIVKTETLDDLIKRNGIDHIDILKIDVEMFEAHVLR